ncbi:MAG: hypothetical protein KKF58_00430 [Gammaproteobacteria bacterium]|nr:hypothetical protein [Gammaproteobacteria bacterium]MBU1446752.1 hypothetical protein [Gammaproteobacteria bacterium]
MNKVISAVEILQRGFEKELLPYYIIALSYILVVFSYPMPPSPGIVEALMGVGLVVACLLILIELKREYLGRSKYISISLGAGSLLVIYPTIHGVVNGLGIAQISRDLLPMVFIAILVPLISYGVKNEQRGKVGGILLASVLFVGAISPIEFIADMKDEFGSMGALSSAFDATYSNPENIQVPTIKEAAAPTAAAPTAATTAPNTFSVRALHMFEPAVIFAAIYCGCLLVLAAMRRQYLQMALCATVVIIALYGFATLRLRAPVGLFAASVLIFIIYMSLHSSSAKERFAITAVVISFCVLGGIVFKDIWWGLIEKTLLVGANGKLEEWAAIFQLMGDRVSNLLFGIGWGAEFVPDYQTQPVRYTHSLISFVLLKSGLLGLLLLALVYGRLIFRQFAQYRNAKIEYEQLALILAGAAVLLIGLAFQPTYKMLGFSLAISILLIMQAKLSRAA